MSIKRSTLPWAGVIGIIRINQPLTFQLSHKDILSIKIFCIGSDSVRTGIHCSWQRFKCIEICSWPLLGDAFLGFLPFSSCYFYRSCFALSKPVVIQWKNNSPMWNLLGALWRKKKYHSWNNHLSLQGRRWNLRRIFYQKRNTHHSKNYTCKIFKIQALYIKVGYIRRKLAGVSCGLVDIFCDYGNDFFYSQRNDSPKQFHLLYQKETLDKYDCAMNGGNV